MTNNTKAKDSRWMTMAKTNNDSLKKSPKKFKTETEFKANE